jgi:hypothetical protein
MDDNVKVQSQCKPDKLPRTYDHSKYIIYLEDK